MRIEALLLYIILYSNASLNTQAQQRKAFVNPQSQCRIKCLNGGFCAYLVDNPSVHTCLCLLNLFYGDRCQFAVVETKTSAQTTTTESAPRRHPAGLESYQHAYELSPSDPEKLADERATTLEMSTSTEVMKKDEDDYTEGWDTGDEEEYTYDENDRSENQKTETTIPLWLRDSDELTNDDATTKRDHPQRIYSSKKNTDKAVTGINGNNRMKSNEEILVQRTSESSNLRNQELIPESESEDEGWMMSKRRRVITNDTNRPLRSLFFFIFVIMPFVRWL